jgi:hypothetical protein
LRKEEWQVRGLIKSVEKAKEAVDLAMMMNLQTGSEAAAALPSPLGCLPFMPEAYIRTHSR